MARMNRRAITLAACTVFASAGLGAAQDDGRFRFVFGGKRDYTTVERGDSSVTAGSIHGLWVVTQGSDSGPFRDEAILHGTCAVTIVTESAAEPDIGADCVLEDAEHDELFVVARRESGDVEEGGGGAGEFTLAGGTGKFADIGGSCPYTVHYMEDDDLVVFAHCDWSME